MKVIFNKAQVNNYLYFFLNTLKELFLVSDEIEFQILIPPYFIERCSRDVLYRGITNLQAKFFLVLNLCTVFVLQKYFEKVIGSFLL